jgi:hypothetical protein
MKRVTTDGGTVAACVWDHAGERSPLTAFWRAARELDLRTQDESDLAGTRKGHLAELFEAAGLTSVEETTLTSSVRFSSFEEWWEPFTLGVGPAGAYAAKLEASARAELQTRCRALFPAAPFTVDSAAWAARGVA